MNPSKSVPEPFLKPYNPNEREPEILKLWEESGYANPDVCIEKGVAAPNAPSYSIVLPPPNVTGTLHMGHAAMLAIQDILIRYHRMRGDRTLWLPGTDHAAIATQSVVEKNLLKSEKKSRHDLGREDFLKRVEKFAQESHDTIVRQVRAMGSSVDWSREAYTLDSARNLAVRTAFKKMYDAGLIYRGARIVNWDPKMQTTVSDDEVVHEETSGTLYTFRYAPDFPIPIATTRPETKLGDTGVAVHPEDKRYKKFIGKSFEVDFAGVHLSLKIVGDEAVDPAFGTGAVGVTPAHSETDWQIAQRHKLPLIQIIDEHAQMTKDAGELVVDKKVAEAREIVAHWLKEQGLLEKEEKVQINLAKAERSGGTIEPLPKLQWWVAVDKEFEIEHSEIPNIASGSKTTLKKMMRTAVESGAIKIAPERFEKVYYNWIDNLHDWCISRQIWYGHRIPVWHCLNCKHIAVDAEVKSRWFLVRHGETENNAARVYQSHSDSPFTAEGKKQIMVAAEKLKNQDIGLIISSDIGRCRETARVISETIGVDVIYDANLRERNFGDREGMTFEEGRDRFGGSYESYDTVRDNGESVKVHEERVFKAFHEHKKIHGGKNVVIVSHGGSIRLLSKRIRNLTFEETRSLPIVSNAEVLPLDVLKSPCSRCGTDLFEQDPDTLDTWFSSGLWTFSTLGWPKNQPLQFSNKMGFAGDIVHQVLDKKTKTYRLRDHGLKIGDIVAFEDSSTRKVFGQGTISDVKETTVGEIDLKDSAHWKTYDKTDDLISAFKRHHPDRDVDKNTPVWIYTYSFTHLDTGANDLTIYHPTSVLETGYDILFFWIARMILMTGFCLGQVPFRNVYLHGLVRDGQGRKMSKSLGNIIDPLVMTEKYGADAARLSLIIGASPGNDVKLSEDRVRGYKHFANKIWNITRFILENSGGESAAQNAEDEKLVAEAGLISKQVSDNIDNFRLDLAADVLYHFVWHRFADEIIEGSKSILKGGGEAAASRRYTLYAILIISLKLLHPFMPFVTEAIWQQLPQPSSAKGYRGAMKDSDMLMVAKWPHSV